MIKKMKKEQLLMLGLIGILLLVIAIPVPQEKDQTGTENALTTVEKEEVTDTTEERLKEVLQKISGVGKVEVFITYQDHGKLVVEKDEKVSEELVEETDSGGGKRRTTTTQKERQTIYGAEETPYIIQELSPSVEGVLIVAEGGENEMVKKQIQRTMEALFGLESHKISIMKMEVSK